MLPSSHSIACTGILSNTETMMYVQQPLLCIVYVPRPRATPTSSASCSSHSGIHPLRQDPPCGMFCPLFPQSRSQGSKCTTLTRGPHSRVKSHSPRIMSHRLLFLVFTSRSTLTPHLTYDIIPILTQAECTLPWFRRPLFPLPIPLYATMPQRRKLSTSFRAPRLSQASPSAKKRRSGLRSGMSTGIRPADAPLTPQPPPLEGHLVRLIPSFRYPWGIL
jgi:hypothetical protein